MTIWDDRILEYVRQEESGSPSELEDSGYLRVSKSHISRRLRKLAEHGLLQHLGNGVYVITDEGEAYLDGEYNAETETYINGSAETPSASPEEVNGS